MTILKTLTIIILACVSLYLAYDTGKALHGPKGVKAKIAAAFSDVNWIKQGFISNGVFVSDLNGNTEFYAAADIDAAIKKLNEVLTDIK